MNQVIYVSIGSGVLIKKIEPHRCLLFDFIKKELRVSVQRILYMNNMTINIGCYIDVLDMTSYYLILKVYYV